MAQFDKAGRIDSDGPLSVIEAAPRLGESTHAAVLEAEHFLVREGEDEDNGGESRTSWAKRIFAKVSSLWSS